MDIKGLKGILSEGSTELGISLTKDGIEGFAKYMRELRLWNKKINLTSVDNDRDIIVRHFLDSLTTAGLFNGGERVLDVGAGAGFPGIPLKIAIPSIDMVLLDSVEKKVHFMRHIIRTLEMKTGIEALSGRVEAPSFVEKYGGGFDVIISRAFTLLSGFITAGLPLLKRGGRIIALKGPSVVEEIKAASSIKGIEGLRVVKVKVPFEGRVNSIVICEKA
ncbi:MAG: 16S rRNA (guanine(527)-N(7))-methyltransferase RsmG [Deltaproteobacteria bacterium]